MQKTIAITAIACLLIVYPFIYFICQTTEAGIGDKITVSQRLTARDNCISDGDIVQESIARIRGAHPGGGPGGNSDDGSEENPGGDQGDGSDSGDDSDEGNDAGPGGGGSSDSNGPTEESSDESLSDETGTAGAASEGLMLGNPTEAVVINEVHPGQEGAFEDRDEMVELYNMGRNPVNVSLWYMKNMTGQVIGTISDKQTLPPRGFLVVEVNGLTGDSQRVVLFDSTDKRVDSVIYIGARSHSGLCFARMPDGLNNWEWAACTLGASNLWGNPG